MIRFLHVQEVLEIHDQIIDCFGGAFGLRDLGLLVSAVEIPKATMSKKLLHPTISDQAAAYLFHICNNHPFIDGNKRTAVVSALVFLEDNHVKVNFDENELEKLVIQTATGKANKKMISSFFQKSNI